MPVAYRSWRGEVGGGGGNLVDPTVGEPCACTLRVIVRGCGVLKEFGPVFVTTDEQAQYAAQGRIDLNLEELEALRRDRSTASANR